MQGCELYFVNGGLAEPLFYNENVMIESLPSRIEGVGLWDCCMQLVSFFQRFLY